MGDFSTHESEVCSVGFSPAYRTASLVRLCTPTASNACCSSVCTLSTDRPTRTAISGLVSPSATRPMMIRFEGHDLKSRARRADCSARVVPSHSRSWCCADATGASACHASTAPPPPVVPRRHGEARRGEARRGEARRGEARRNGVTSQPPPMSTGATPTTPAARSCEFSPHEGGLKRSSGSHDAEHGSTRTQDCAPRLTHDSNCMAG